MHVEITDKVVKGLVKEWKESPHAKGNKLTWDTGIRGFGVCVTAAGNVSFVYNYRVFGRQKRITIGSYPAWTVSLAREKVGELKKQVDKSKLEDDVLDPLEAKRARRNALTFADLIDRYLQSGEFAKKRESTKRDYRRMAEKILRPKLGKLRVRAIVKDDIEKLHADMKTTPYQANRLLALVSILFNFEKAENPAAEIKRYTEDPREQRRDGQPCYLSNEEIARFNEALDNYRDKQAANALRLLLFTGARLSEVIKAEWSQFDLKRGVWIKPSHHVKQNKMSTTPLIQEAIDLLRSMKPEKASGPVFPGRDPKTGRLSAKRARVSVKRPWIQTLRAAGLVEIIEVEGKRKGPDGKPRMLKRYKPLVRIHDLRHNFCSHLVLNGVPLKTVGQLVGHTQVATTTRYANLANDDLRTAADKFSNVIQFAKRPA